MKLAHITIMGCLTASVCLGDAYQGYEGDRRENEEVVLHLPSDMAVLQVDGKAMRKRGHLLGAIYEEILLLPGPHQLTLRYEDLWDHDQGDDYEKLRSKPVTVSFNPQTAGHYTLIHSRPQSLREAQALERSFSAAAISFQKTGDAHPIPATAAKESTPPPLPPAPEMQSTVDVLKYWWERTSENEREAFLRWVETTK
jgi:uncharacterized protein YccT (UPF0319 family)